MEAYSFIHQPNNVTASKTNKSVCDKSTLTFPSHTFVKAKLEFTGVGDPDEVEADNTANDIVNGGKISRKISDGNSSSGVRVSTALENQLSHMQGGGQSMPSGLQSMMSKGFGRDFSQVRLHTDSQAAEMSSSINAKAFTLGNDIYFNKGEYSPSTTEGQRLVAHELTHVVQDTHKVARESNNGKELEGAVTVVLICSPTASGGAFFDSEGVYDDPLKLQDTCPSAINIFIDDNDSLEQISQKLDERTRNYHVQNLIISGHGNWYGILLSKNEKGESVRVDSLSQKGRQLLKMIQTVMHRNKDAYPNLEQTIYLASCLTNSHNFIMMPHRSEKFGKEINAHSPAGTLASYMNFSETLQSIVGSDVHVISNSITAIKGHQSVSFDKNGTMSIADDLNPTTLNSVNDGIHVPSEITRKNGKWTYTKGQNSYDPKKSKIKFINRGDFSIGVALEAAEILYNLLNYPNLTNDDLNQIFGIIERDVLLYENEVSRDANQDNKHTTDDGGRTFPIYNYIVKHYCHYEFNDLIRSKDTDVYRKLIEAMFFIYNARRIYDYIPKISNDKKFGKSTDWSSIRYNLDLTYNNKQNRDLAKEIAKKFFYISKREFRETYKDMYPEWFHSSSRH